MCSNIGTPNNHHFPFGTNGKIVVLGVPILKHFRVSPFEVDHLLSGLLLNFSARVTAHDKYNDINLVPQFSVDFMIIKQIVTGGRSESYFIMNHFIYD